MFRINMFLFGVAAGIWSMTLISAIAEHIAKPPPVEQQTVQCVVELHPKLNRKETVRYHGTVRKQI